MNIHPYVYACMCLSVCMVGGEQQVVRNEQSE